ncbi:MAG: alpha/beta hydrolase [Clostridia bacterium]|nr:alpha/beta hydrolase [Clostridia bacterium]
MTVSRDYFISEENYKSSMQETVEPYLRECARDGYFEALDGKKIHYVFYKAASPVGNMTISHGFTESAEKFREMCYYFLRMNLNVFIIDHRGHGLSHRHNDDLQVVHIKNFDQYINDLQSLVKKVILKEAPGLPMYLYSHSMGGAIAVQHLQTHPGVFEKAILSAPMIKARTAGIPEGIAKFAARTFIMFGKEKNKVMGYKPFNPERTYEESHDTSEQRFCYYHEKRKADQYIQTSAPSYRWVSEAIRVSKLNLDTARNSRIKAKVLLCQPEEDSSVFSDKEDEFIKLVKNGKLIKFTNCKHEIYMSVDNTVKEYLDTIENFLFNE